MPVELSYTLAEWHALAALLRRPGAPTPAEPDLAARLQAEMARAWFQRQQNVSITMTPADAEVLTQLRAGLPETEALAAIAEAERIIREHQRRWLPR